MRTLILRDFDAAYASVDLLIAPAAPTTAFPLGAKTDDPLSMYLSDTFTIPSSLAGHPALSVPFGPTPPACRWASSCSARPSLSRCSSGRQRCWSAAPRYAWSGAPRYA